MSYSTVEERRTHQQAYRKRLAASGGRRIDLVVDGRLSKRLAVLLAGYGYASHPGSAIRQYLEDQAKA